MTGTAAEHAAYWQIIGLTDLGTLGGTNSRAEGVNDAGQVVGSADTSAELQHAFVWEDGVMTDLNDLLPPDSGWVLTRAVNINEAGQIVGRGTINGETHAFLLSPVCPGDLDGDGGVGLSDLATLLSNFGTPAGANPEDGDLDGDGDVDLSDLANLLSNFGSICS